MNSPVNVATYSGMEKDLNDDAAWKKIQQNTFTRWVNERLKCVNLRVQNIEKDFSDGLMLIALVEVLSQKRIYRYNKKPTLRTHQLENVSLALKFLEDKEKVHLVNIDSSDIVDQRLKLILGLIWTLILKYSISMPIMAAEDQKDVTQKETPKQRLLGYIQAKIPSGGVTNFTSDWKDGRALGALVDSCAPGLCPDWSGWHQKYALQNTTEAMNLADDWLGVPKLIEPQEFINPNVDEMSMMTYLSQYSNAKLKDGAPIRPETDYSKIRVFGAGIDADYVPMCATADFMIEVPDAVPNAGRLEVVIQHYTGLVEPVYISYHDETHTYVVSYVPTAQGVYNIYISYNGRDLSSSPYKIQVEPAREEKTLEKREADFVDQAPEKVDTTKIIVDQMKSEVFVNADNDFRIDCRLLPKHGLSHLTCFLIEPSGQRSQLTIADNEDGTYKVNFAPKEEGTHNFEIFYDDIPVSHAIFSTVAQVDLKPVSCSVTGPGLRHAFVNVPANFIVDTKDAGSGKLNIQIEGPQETPMECLDQKDGSYLINYTPTVPGDFKVSILFDQRNVEGSPFVVRAEYPVDSQKVKAYGTGLETGIASPGVPVTFHVDASDSGGSAPLNVKVVPEKGDIDRLPEIVERGVHQYDVVCYTPAQGSGCTIHITYGDKEIMNSPYHLKILSSKEPGKIRLLSKSGDKQVIPLGDVPASVPVEFTVDTSKAGPAKLEVIVVGPDDEPYPVEVLDRENGLYDVSFVPDITGPYKVVVKHDGREAADSPYKISAQPSGDASKCQILEGISNTVVIDQENQLTVNASQAGVGFVTCRIVPQILSPLLEKTVQNPVDMQIKHDESAGIFCIKYRLRQPGQYRISVKFGGQDVPKGEWPVMALPPDTIHVSELLYTAPGNLDEKRALSDEKYETTGRISPGNLQISESTLTEEYSASGDYSRRISTRTTTSTSTTKTTTSQEGWTEKVAVLPDQGEGVVEKFAESEAAQATTPLLPSPNYPAEFWNIAVPGKLDRLETYVTMPGGKTDLPVIKDNKDGTVTVKYQPKERGLHEMHILFDKVHVQGSPFQFHVEDAKDGHVTAYGPGLTYGSIGEPCTFTVCVKDAGAGGLSVLVDGPAKAEIQCHDNKDGTCSVSWLPPVPGEYKIAVKFADKEIKGSPFVVRIAGESRKRAHISLGSTSEVALKITEPDLKGMSSSIKSPSGIEEPCSMRILHDGHLGISFTPREVGEHLVTVKKRNVLLPGAPFRISVGDSEVGNAGKVKLSGAGLEVAHTQEFNEFVVNTQKAGFGGLSVSVEGPSKSEIVCKENKDGMCVIHYKPTEPGIYVLSVKFADHHVPGSPFTVKCQGVGAGTVSEKVQQDRKPANVVFADQECQLCLKVPGTSPMDMAAKLTSPSLRVEDIELYDLADSTYMIKFTPKEQGLHAVSVLHQGNHISGSPFQFTVGPFQEGGAHKVRAGGTGLHRGEVNASQSFNIYTREAGAGNLSIAVEGPSKAKIDFKEHKDGNCYVTYSVSKPGDYTVAVKFDEQHVPDSPFKVYVSPSTGESRKLEVVRFPGMGLPLNKPVTFTVLTHGAKGHLDAKVTAPSGSEDDCFISPIDEGESYAVRFIPKEAGNHYVHIRLDGIHMKDSPFRIRIGGKDEGDPTAVTAAGDGLNGGETGQKLEYIINTCNAGAGILSVSIDGPSRVTLDAYEVDIGYKVRYTPLAPGDYFMTIKYNTVHIPGSPFKVPIAGKTLAVSDFVESANVQITTVAKTGKGSIMDVPKLRGEAVNVQSKGPGLKKGNLARQTQFTIDTSQAGDDILFIGILTPKGPCEEISVKHQGKGVFNVSYVIRERGMSFIFVRYGSKDIPGSPFPVEVN